MKTRLPLYLIIIFCLAVLIPLALPGGGVACAAGGEVYLTFDDGPSFLTSEILETLNRYGVKATFFVVGNMAERYPKTLRLTAAEGHTVGLHCYKHDYKEIYKNTASFTADLIKCKITVERLIPGYKAEFYRFPGGSFGLRKEYLDAVSAMNLTYKDWNAVNGDSGSAYSPLSAAQCAIETAAGRRRVVLLMHDNKSVTAKALPQIIEYFRDEGYVFRAF